VVFAALSPDWCSDTRGSELEAALESYLIAVAGGTGLQLWTIGRILRRKLEEMVARGARQPAFRYALLSVWDPAELRLELVGDPVADADTLAGRPPVPLAVIAIIEAVEQLFLCDKFEGDEIAKVRLRERLQVFDKLAALPNLSNRQVAEIEHHRGKALKRLGDASLAAEHFERVLAGSAPMHESRLQLIDIYRADQAKVERAIQLVDEVLGKRVGEQDVSYSVLLGVMERLPWGSGGWRAGLIRRHADAIERTIVEAAEVGVLQAIRAFAALGRYLSTEEQQMFRRIFDRLPEPTPESLQTDSDRFAWAEIYFEAARTAGEDAPELQGKALAMHEAEVRPQRFHLQRRAELLIEMGLPAQAELLLRARNDLDNSEWLQRLMARSRLAQGDAEGALLWIDMALERLKAEHFRSEFLELRYDIRTALGDTAAIEDLRSARAASQKAAEAARLNARLAQAEFPARA
jgi:tetratricopeptide (TPR) repeat protein